jgi:hypothetical protein
MRLSQVKGVFFICASKRCRSISNTCPQVSYYRFTLRRGRAAYGWNRTQFNRLMFSQPVDLCVRPRSIRLKDQYPSQPRPTVLRRVNRIANVLRLIDACTQP